MNTRAGQKPNVILIILDDLGSVDLNCYGSADLYTPNLDALAASGVRLTQFYSGSPVCSASRTATLTGRFPLRAGMPSNANSNRFKTDGSAVSVDEVFLSQMFKSAGYATGHIGKWHLGYSPATMPNARGFDHSFGHMGGCIDNYSHFMYWEGPNQHDLWENGKEIWREGQHIGDLTVAECNRFIDAHRSEPFFLYWALSQPHYPLQASAKWREHYAHLPSPPRSMYAASVSMLDELIGQVLAQVKESGLAERTIVIFQSDHGHSTEERNFWGGGSAGPYRGAKFSMFEGGIRVPGIIAWPGTMAAGQVRGQLVTGCDWMPTLSELTGVPLPARRLDGKSMLPVLQSADAPTRHDIFHWKLFDQWACRQGNWKLIGNPRDTNVALLDGDDRVFLSNLEQDIGEKRNLAADHPDLVTHLSALHEQWVRDLADRS
jgi:arylsulfatase A